ncbi:MAG: Ku protein [Acidobacteria bacterium]|nr:Ku protein [Acidobacteriota bacterium]
MARPVWKGSISFGLVNVPVELHKALRDRRPRFRLLHSKDLSPISMERVCQRDGHAVAWADLVKGYEVEKGTFIALTADDFKTAAVERSRAITITEFVPIDDIDPSYWDVPYEAAPGKGGESTCVLLATALEKSGRAGIAKYVMRDREHLAAVRGLDGHLLLTTLRFEEDLAELPKVKRGDVKAKELSLAMQLIDGLAADWEPSRYKDDYVPALMKVIKAKAKGKTVTPPAETRVKTTNVVDLVERLRASLAAAGDTKPARTSAKRSPARKQVSSKRTAARKTTRKTGASRKRTAA